MSKTYRVKALECEQNGKKFYITLLNSSILEQTCYVARRDEDSKKGFQRTLNQTRAKAIARYLDEDKGVIPTALILSAQTNSNFSYSKTSQSISFKGNKNSFLVLDGQHRLFGLALSKYNYLIPVIIFNNLRTTREVNLFIDINTTQKGVPTTLLLDIKNLTGKETTKEEKQRELFDKLNKKSVLAGLMSPSKSMVGKITRVTFNASTDTIFETGFFQNKDNLTIYKAVSNYLEAAEKTFIKSKSSKAKLTNSIFFRALFMIFNDIVYNTLEKFGNLKTKSFEEVLEPISRLNYDVYIGTNKATLQRVVTDMKNELTSDKKHYDNLRKRDLF